MASSIGIKIANGEFYPLVEENSSIKKKLTLTTVHDNQSSVQIDLFRSAGKVMADAQYIGSLVIENIRPKPKGEPSLEMVISSNEDGEIIADAIDLDTGSGGEHHVLTVSIKSLDETASDIELPDFEMESGNETPSGLYQHADEIKHRRSGRFPVWLIVIGLIIILGLLAVWLFLLGGMNVFSSRADRPQQVVQTEPVRQPEPVMPPDPVIEPIIPEPVQQPVIEPAIPEPIPQPVIEPIIPEPVQQIEEPVPVIQAPVVPPVPAPQNNRVRPAPPVASYNVPAVIPREGVNYTIRYGDTLWDISEAFYREPRLYTRIAQHNNIRNPNYIISGTTIRIPPRN